MLIYYEKLFLYGWNSKNEIAACNWAWLNTAGIMLGALQIRAHLIPILILEVGNILILQGNDLKMLFIIYCCVYGAWP